MEQARSSVVYGLMCSEGKCAKMFIKQDSFNKHCQRNSHNVNRRSVFVTLEYDSKEIATQRSLKLKTILSGSQCSLNLIGREVFEADSSLSMESKEAMDASENKVLDLQEKLLVASAFPSNGSGGGARRDISAYALIKRELGFTDGQNFVEDAWKNAPEEERKRLCTFFYGKIELFFSKSPTVQKQISGSEATHSSAGDACTRRARVGAIIYQALKSKAGGLVEQHDLIVEWSSFFLKEIARAQDAKVAEQVKCCYLEGITRVLFGSNLSFVSMDILLGDFCFLHFVSRMIAYGEEIEERVDQEATWNMLGLVRDWRGKIKAAAKMQGLDLSRKILVYRHPEKKDLIVIDGLTFPSNLVSCMYRRCMEELEDCKQSIYKLFGSRGSGSSVLDAYVGQIEWKDILDNPSNDGRTPGFFDSTVPFVWKDEQKHKALSKAVCHEFTYLDQSKLENLRKLLCKFSNLLLAAMHISGGGPPRCSGIN